MAAVSARLVDVFTHAARASVPLIVHARTPRGLAVLRDVVVAQVRVDRVVVRSRLGRLRSVVSLSDVESVSRLDGRTFDPRPRGARADVAAQGDEHVDRGGIE